MGVVIILAILIYIVVSVAITLLIFMKAKRIAYGFLAVIFFILLPTWDVLLGKIVYAIACRYIPKVAIYETAVTDGIYYEGTNDDYYDWDQRGDEPLSERRHIGAASWILNEGYRYIEARVTKDPMSIPIKPLIYRCTENSSEKPSMPGTVRTSCAEIDLPESPYMVKVTKRQVGTASFQFKKILERSTGKLLGEYNQVVYAYIKIPFFNWLIHGDWSIPTIRCPTDELGKYPNGKFNTFEYKVLKPKNKQTGERK